MARYLKLFTLLAATAFAAIAIYISLVEQPARLLLEDKALLDQWAASYPPAMRIQSALAVLSGLSAIGAWYLSRSPLWLAGAALMLANWPYTLLVIYPVNEALLSMAAGASGETGRALIEQWGSLHAVRTGLGLVATGLFAFALLRDARGEHWLEAHAK